MSFNLNDATIINNNFSVKPDGTISPDVVIPGQLILSGFNVNSTGKLAYTVTGKPITALTGTLKVGTVDRTLTHVSSGIATIGGGAITSSDTPLSVTLTATTPALTTDVTSANVINNVPAPPPLVKRTLTFASPATQNGDNYTAPTGAFLITPTVVSANAFEIIYRVQTNADVLVLQNTADVTTSWPPAATTVVGAVYNANGSLNLFDPGSTTAVNGGAPLAYYKLKKVGNDIVITGSSDGTIFGSTIRTFTNALSVNTVYLKLYTISAAGAGAIQLFT